MNLPGPRFGLEYEDYEPGQKLYRLSYGNFGVRVWKGYCQAIKRDDDVSVWVGQENILPVPVPDSILGFPHAGIAPVNALACQVARLCCNFEG